MATDVCGGGYAGAHWDGIKDICVYADYSYASEVGAIELAFLVDWDPDIGCASYVYETVRLTPCPTKIAPANITHIFEGRDPGYYEASLSNFDQNGNWMCMGIASPYYSSGPRVYISSCSSLTECAIYGSAQPCTFNQVYFSKNCSGGNIPPIPPKPPEEACPINVKIL